MKRTASSSSSPSPILPDVVPPPHVTDDDTPWSAEFFPLEDWAICLKFTSFDIYKHVKTNRMMALARFFGPNASIDYYEVTYRTAGLDGTNMQLMYDGPSATGYVKLAIKLYDDKYNDMGTLVGTDEQLIDRKFTQEFFDAYLTCHVCLALRSKSSNRSTCIRCKTNI